MRRAISYDEAMGHATEADELRQVLGTGPSARSKR
jgi:hypothetical protein